MDPDGSAGDPWAGAPSDGVVGGGVTVVVGAGSVVTSGAGAAGSVGTGSGVAAGGAVGSAAGSATGSGVGVVRRGVPAGDVRAGGMRPIVETLGCTVEVAVGVGPGVVTVSLGSAAGTTM